MVPKSGKIESKHGKAAAGLRSATALRITSRGDVAPRLVKPYGPTVKEGLPVYWKLPNGFLKDAKQALTRSKPAQRLRVGAEVDASLRRYFLISKIHGKVS